jgi:hypothetical protein
MLDAGFWFLVAGYWMLDSEQRKKAASRKETAFFAGFGFIILTSKFVIFTSPAP